MTDKTVEHSWELKGGTTAGGTPITLWQCQDCERAASRVSTAPGTDGLRLATPEIDAHCEGTRGG